MAGDRVAGPDPDGDPAILVHRHEGLLVGEVVADEDRAPAGIGRLAQEGPDGMALRGARRQDLGHRLALLQPVGFAEDAGDRGRGRLRPHGIGLVREPPMHRDRAALVLDQHAVEIGDRPLQGLDARPKGGMRRRIAAGHPAVSALLDPVQAGDVEALRRQEPVDRGDRPPGHERHRPAEAPAQPREAGGQVGRDHHPVGPGRDLHQGAVEVEEEGEGGVGQGIESPVAGRDRRGGATGPHPLLSGAWPWHRRPRGATTPRGSGEAMPDRNRIRAPKRRRRGDIVSRSRGRPCRAAGSFVRTDSIPKGVISAPRRARQAFASSPVVPPLGKASSRCPAAPGAPLSAAATGALNDLTRILLRCRGLVMQRNP
ncbi:hypothetical protein Maq22A_c27850 [Methylobacterium aquaticum]|uniref:Uncharacterized protein n=1 Tax=Methylobacterium aquaticum TaxID=270351 RepID=A0A1Y0ZFY9_9HYPH|nr:hypothetical protein Maq22A_c27850 [Methylobacterium aquaticum]